MRTSCPNCNLPVIISASDVPAGLPCPRCHSPLEAHTEHGFMFHRVIFTVGFVLCIALVPSYLLIGDSAWVDQYMDLALGALSR